MGDRTGRGVVVGVVDLSMNPFHPVFGGAVQGIWDHGAVHGGAEHKSGLGRIITNEEDWRKRSGLDTPDDKIRHGTIVGAIAAGRDPVGFAPEAELFASVIEDFDMIPQAVEWIFKMAEAYQLPAVVNVSLGSDHIDPHDGTDTVSQRLDELSGPGRLLVAAAGNDAHLGLHARRRVGPSVGTAHIPMVAYSPEMTVASVGMFSVENRPFSFRFRTRDLITNQTIEVFDWLELGESWSSNTGSWRVAARNGDLVRAASALIQFTPTSDKTPATQWSVELRSHEETTIDVWSADGNCMLAEAEALASPNFAPAPEDAGHLVGAPAVARSVVAVGAADGDQVARFSNNGPSIDGRLKPEIVLPGVGLSVAGVEDLDGTSYSAPMLTGMLACVLQTQEQLSPEQAVTLLRQSCDEVSDAPGWGFGKLRPHRLWQQST